jgi:DNA-binding MarR family transcriptional regulator
MAEPINRKKLNELRDVDRLIHEPARLIVLTILATVKSADFLYLQRETELTKGNLSAHLTKLEDAGYVKITKSFKGKRPHTDCKISAKGRQAYEGYVHQLGNALGTGGAKGE